MSSLTGPDWTGRDGTRRDVTRRDKGKGWHHLPPLIIGAALRGSLSHAPVKQPYRLNASSAPQTAAKAKIAVRSCLVIFSIISWRINDWNMIHLSVFK